MTAIETETASAGEYPQLVRVRAHALSADAGPASGDDSASGPHDDLDVALATCKAPTATWDAKRHQLPLELELMTTSDVQIETVLP